MAHDFGIRNTKRKEYAYFFGYANGLMYEAFGEQKHNAIFSGDNGTEIKTREENEKALDYAIKTFDGMGYPDPSRLDAIKKFREDMAHDGAQDLYEIWFS